VGAEPVSAVLLLLAAAWSVAALLAAARRAGRIAAGCGLLAALHVAVALWSPAAALAAAGWLGYLVTAPDLRSGSSGRRLVLAIAGLVGVVWTAGVATHVVASGSAALAWATLAIAAAGGTALLLRCRHAAPGARHGLQWLAAGIVLAVGLDVVLVALHVLIDAPDSPGPWLVASLAFLPLAQALATWSATAPSGEAALVESVVIAGLAGLVVAVYLVVVVGLNRVPVDGERDVLIASMAAAVVVAVLAMPARQRLVGFARGLVGRREASAEEVVATFGARMSRAVPMDELMLQLAESLRATIAPGGAEIWVGADGALTRAVAVPTRAPGRLVLGSRERVVVSRARIGGPSWSSVWLADLVEPGQLRVAPVAHLGELLGLIVARRGGDAADFTEDEDRQLVELARQLGLALHNVRLDSALQASLEELERRNAELQASRLRIVTASDESRRAIERNLHDGAQQHLVALAVKLGLASQIAEDDPLAVVPLLDELRDDVRTTIAELRELAHGIYPPLLRDQGLGEALRAAAARSPQPCSVRVDLPGRYPPEAETAAYFCCLEALQNAGKHAGSRARVTVSVGCDPAGLWFEVSDDGAGFAADASGLATPASLGHGFVNMEDRLGAIGGTLTVISAPGEGTRVRGAIPSAPRDAGDVRIIRPADPSAVGG
jgi:signal transduction histidine kinase